MAWVYDIYRYTEKDGKQICECIDSSDWEKAALGKVRSLNRKASYNNRKERYRCFAYEEA